MPNHQVRDTVFRDYFNNTERLLSLGNALLGTNYTDSFGIVIQIAGLNFKLNASI